jgi:HEAT repeat protein
VLHQEIRIDVPVEAVIGVSFERDVNIWAPAYVGCAFSATAEQTLGPSARLIGCVLEPTTRVSNGHASLSSTDPLVKLLIHGNDMERPEAVNQIRARGAVSYLPLLCSRLDDREWLVRSNLLTAATELWSSDSAAATVIARTLCYALGDEHSIPRMAAGNFVSRVGVEYAADIVEELDSPLVSLRQRALRALITLHERGLEKGHVIPEQTWAALLSDSDKNLRIETLQTLYRIDHQCPRRLIEAASNDDDPDVRAEAAELLDIIY